MSVVFSRLKDKFLFVKINVDSREKDAGCSDDDNIEDNVNDSVNADAETELVSNVDTDNSNNN